jgi:hypothetical protein
LICPPPDNDAVAEDGEVFEAGQEELANEQEQEQEQKQDEVELKSAPVEELLEMPIPTEPAQPETTARIESTLDPCNADFFAKKLRKTGISRTRNGISGTLAEIVGRI